MIKIKIKIKKRRLLPGFRGKKHGIPFVGILSCESLIHRVRTKYVGRDLKIVLNWVWVVL